MNGMATIVGVAASLCSMASFVPQAWKTMRTGDTRALSIGMYSLTVSGFALWTLYGVMIALWPLVVSNSICLVLSGAILAMALAHRRQ